jgi:tetratricopeptide (TPR) repeat protein
VEEARVAHLSVPTTLVGLLQARLDGLLYPERLTLQRAAVVGRVFWEGALAALDAADEVQVDDLPGVLRRLAGGEFVHLRETTAFQRQAEYAFAGNMLRDVLLGTLLRRQRRAYNLAAAGWLVEISGERAEEYDGAIAGYYERAGEGARAARHLGRAGAKALRGSAFAEARVLLERALALLPEGEAGEGGLSLRLRLGEAQRYLGDYGAARETLGGALEAARAAGDGARAAEALYWLSQVAVAEGSYARAQGYLEESLPLARASGDVAMLARALYGLGDLHWRLGELEEARACCAQSLALARQLGDAAIELYALNRLGVLAFRQGDPGGGQRLLEEMHARALQVGNRERAASALNNLGEISRRRGDPEAAQAYYRRALPITRDTGEHSMLGILLSNLADVSIRLGDVEAARRHLREGLALALRAGAAPVVLMGVACASYLLASQGDVDRGLALLGLCQYHPASFSETRADVNDMLELLGLDPGDPAVIAGLERGRELDLQATVDRLVAELNDAG